MKPLKLFEGLSPKEKRVLTSAFLLLLLLIAFVNLYDFASFGSGENEIGEIQEFTNNTRLKSKKRVLWEDAKKKQSVHVGDKIFTGKKSTATVKLGRQGAFSLGENSLVEFQVNNKEKLANFKNGTYRLFSNGKLKVAINGKIAEIDAKDSEFELVISGTNGVQIKTIKGSGQIKINNKVTSLVSGQAQTISIDRMTKTAERVKIDHFTVAYTPKLYDEYVRENGTLQKRRTAPVVKHSVRLPIPVTNLSEAILVEHSNQNTFSTKYDYRIFGLNKKINQAFLGQNFWRYKQNTDPWSDAHTFDVVREFPPHSKAELVVESASLYLLDSSVEAALKIVTPQDNLGYVVEVSRSNNFEPNSALSWQTDKNIALKITQVGTFYVRARSVNSEYQLGEWSDTHNFTVIAPPQLKPLELKLSSHAIRVGESVFARWEPQATIKQYRFHVHKGGQKVLSVPLQASSSDWFPKVPGTYTLSVSATDQFGRAVSSNKEDVQVAEPYILTKTDLPPRKPAQSDEANETQAPVDLTTTIAVESKARNTYYTHSFLTISTSHFSLQSKPLNNVTTDFAQSAAFTIDYLYWLNNHGFQAILQKTIVPLSSGAAVSDLLIGEGRYRYRITPRDGTRFFNAFQLAAFLGYEYYRNSKDDFFLSTYKFMKLGMAVDIPMFERFVISGLGAYGMQSGAIKYEMGWDFTYFLQNRMGIGLGYKLHFVEFDLTNEFPGYAPYREAYAQGMVNFKYFF